MPRSHCSQGVRRLASRHQVVAVIGARGTGKTAIRDDLLDNWARAGVKTVNVEASLISQPLDLLSPIADTLRCDPQNLTAHSMPADSTLRIVVDRCEELFDKSWFPYAQEHLRALLSTPESRGRVGVVLFGRPLFREIAGGQGSPLLNLGCVVTVTPLGVDQALERLGVSREAAGAILRKTGGHPHLTRLLAEATGGRVDRLGEAIPEFVEANERYLVRLVEDHTITGATMLHDLVARRGRVSETTLVNRHFGTQYAEAMDVLADLTGSGLIERRDGTVALAAELVRSSAVVRRMGRRSGAEVPLDAPEQHGEAARVVYRVENQLRRLVVEQLSGVDEAWWSTRLQSHVSVDAESRRRAELESPASVDEALHPIMYLNLGELFELIGERRNWNEVFQLALNRSRPTVDAAAHVMTAVRNKMAHSRPVSRPDLVAFEASARSLGLEPSSAEAPQLGSG